jgi:hypothetical protein
LARFKRDVSGRGRRMKSCFQKRPSGLAQSLIIASVLSPAVFGLSAKGTGARTRLKHPQSTSTSTSAAPSAHKKKSHSRHHSRREVGQKAPTPDRIKDIQSALSRDGYYQGEPNGKMDSDTVAALQKFQTSHGLDPSGKLDAPTLQKMGLGSDIAGVSAPKPAAPPTCCATSASTTTPAASISQTTHSICCSAPSPSSKAPASVSPSTATPDTKTSLPASPSSPHSTSSSNSPSPH